jgi:hypothetical protein
MSERIEAARSMRTDAERLRTIATRKKDPKLAAELTRIARQMDKHSAELDSLFVDKPPSPANDASA